MKWTTKRKTFSLEPMTTVCHWTEMQEEINFPVIGHQLKWFRIYSLQLISVKQHKQLTLLSTHFWQHNVTRTCFNKNWLLTSTHTHTCIIQAYVNQQMSHRFISILFLLCNNTANDIEKWIHCNWISNQRKKEKAKKWNKRRQNENSFESQIA